MDNKTNLTASTSTPTPTPLPSSFSDKDIENIKKEAFTTCAFCASRYPERLLVEYELTTKEAGKEPEMHGWYVCRKCVNSERDRIQQKVVHTWLVIKARGERPCCGGSEPPSS